MITCKRGDTVLVNFVFSDETGIKMRPGVVISTDEYNFQREEIIISAITNNIDRILFGDSLIREWQKAGLLCPSLATGIIRTIKRGMISRKLGTLSPADFKTITDNLSSAILD
jgi:mRNA interferase MazF